MEKSKGSSKEAVINAMVKKILEFEKQGKRVSLHCVSLEQYKKLNVIDISYKHGNLVNAKEFIRFLNEQEAVKRIIHPIAGSITSSKISYDLGEPAIHVEVEQ